MLLLTSGAAKTVVIPDYGGRSGAIFATVRKRNHRGLYGVNTECAGGSVRVAAAAELQVKTPHLC